MGTRLDAVFIDIEDEKADSLASRLRKELDKLENILSNYKTDSELSVLNRTAYGNDIKVSPFLLKTIALCIHYYELTKGVFDPGKGKLTGSSDSRMKRKGGSGVSSLIESSGMGQVELKKSRKTVRFHGKNVKIDSGGFGKGLAIKKVKEVLISEGINNALVSFGESSVLALGAHPHGKHWPIAVADIYKKQSIARLAMLTNKSISTSGTGFVDDKGMFKASYNVFDPRTGETIDEPRTVSVISDDPLEAEILSTALLIDSDCLPGDFDRKGKEAFAVIYDFRKNFIVKDIF
ncbi:MAG: FAD:protein FMN transferase [Bacteroidales bacterium]|nr:FAD:protein FMN transferase [Bacteroidales bacterium]